MPEGGKGKHCRHTDGEKEGNAQGHECDGKICGLSRYFTAFRSHLSRQLDHGSQFQIRIPS